MILHACNVHCHAMDSDEMNLLGIESDNGKWLPFTFLLDVVVAIKLTSDSEEDMTYNCTTIFKDDGDVFIIDTPYTTFQRIWKDYLMEVDEEEQDLEL